MPRAGAREMRMRDAWCVGGAERCPRLAVPAEPAVAILVEHEQRLVAQLRELRAPARATADGVVSLDGADDVDFLAVVDLIPERLQHLADGRPFEIATMHQAGDVLEADVAVEQLLVI